MKRTISVKTTRSELHSMRRFAPPRASLEATPAGLRSRVYRPRRSEGPADLRQSATVRKRRPDLFEGQRVRLRTARSAARAPGPGARRPSPIARETRPTKLREPAGGDCL